jgi:HK97 gp10 family phage protein
VRINVQIANLQSEIRKVQRYTENKVQGIKSAVVESGVNILSEATTNAAVDTGNLKNSGDLRITNDGLEAEVFFTAEYAPHVEFGTRPHKIKAAPGKMLHFKVNGRDVFAKEVNHPGTPAQPFLHPAHERERPLFIRKLREELRRST